MVGNNISRASVRIAVAALALSISVAALAVTPQAEPSAQSCVGDLRNLIVPALPAAEKEIGNIQVDIPPWMRCCV
jgi:hypothetical protein